MKMGLAGAALAAAFALSACNEGYGYGGLDVGYGGGYYADGYYDRGYGHYDPAYYGGGFGWFDGFYYPGTGYYVYDRYRRPYRWNGAQQRYWQGRGDGAHGGYHQPNWQPFDRGGRDFNRSGAWRGNQGAGVQGQNPAAQPGYGRPQGQGAPAYGQGHGGGYRRYHDGRDRR